VPIVFKPGSLNLLEPSGPVQACNGIALPNTRQYSLYGHCQLFRMQNAEAFNKTVKEEWFQKYANKFKRLHI
jgi:hypothetical protein